MIRHTCKHCGSVLFSIPLGLPEFRKPEPATACPSCDRITRKPA